MTSSNDVINFDDHIEARRFIRGWCAKFKRATGKTVDYCDTNAGRIAFDRMTDDEALFVAKDLHRMETTKGAKNG